MKKINKKLRSFFKRILGYPMEEIKREVNVSFLRNVDFHNSEIGGFSYISNNSIVHNTKIGNFCSIGPNAVIGFGDHPIHLLSTSPAFYNADCSFEIKPSKNLYFGNDKVRIGNDVWIGSNVFVKNGVSIGDGAVIGAGAVVLKDIPPYAIVVGVPGIIKSYRFSKETIDLLLRIKWWDLDPQIIKENFELFTSKNIIDNLDLISKLKNRET